MVFVGIIVGSYCTGRIGNRGPLGAHGLEFSIVSGARKDMRTDALASGLELG